MLKSIPEGLWMDAHDYPFILDDLRRVQRLNVKHAVVIGVSRFLEQSHIQFMDRDREEIYWTGDYKIGDIPIATANLFSPAGHVIYLNLRGRLCIAIEEQSNEPLE